MRGAFETWSRHTNKRSWKRTTETSWRRSTETSLGVSFETYLRRCWDVQSDVVTTSTTSCCWVGICTTKRHHSSFSYAMKREYIRYFKIQTANNVVKQISIWGFKNYFLTYSALQTLVQPNLCLLLRLSHTLNIFNVSFSSSLNKLNTLSPNQKFVQIGNAHNLGSSLI